MPKSNRTGLSAAQVQDFIDDGFVKLQHAFSPDLASTGRDLLWAEAVWKRSAAEGDWWHRRSADGIIRVDWL
ncbi:MAG: hypothetical protein R3D59_15670 [Paracoccaceae bacterium]